MTCLRELTERNMLVEEPPEKEIQPSIREFLSADEAYAGLLTFKQSNMPLAIDLLERTPLEGLSTLVQAQFLVVMAVSDEKRVSKEEPASDDVIRKAMCSLIDQKLDERFVRFVSWIRLSAGIKAKTLKRGKVEYLTEFDAWVYGIWEKSQAQQDALNYDIAFPAEFALKKDSPQQQSERMLDAYKKLECLGLINAPSKQEPIIQRRKQVAQRVAQQESQEGRRNVAQIARELGCTRAKVMSDIKVLQKQGALPGVKETGVKPKKPFYKWVYEHWVKAEHPLKMLVEEGFFPEEFAVKGEPYHNRYSRIQTALIRMKAEGIIDQNYEQRRRKVRRERIRDFMSQYCEAHGEEITGIAKIIAQSINQPYDTVLYDLREMGLGKRGKQGIRESVSQQVKNLQPLPNEN